jgi:DNA-binding transcriptional LysR family regulator
VLAVAPGGSRVGSDPAKIAAIPIVDHFPSGPLIDRWMSHHFGRRRARHGHVVAWTGSGTELALELTLRGVGACVLPRDLVDPYRKAGELTVVRGRRSPLRDDIWLNEIDATHSSPIQTAFREALL